MSLLLAAFLLLSPSSSAAPAAPAPAAVQKAKPLSVPELKERVHEVQLGIRRARYALRKARDKKDAKAAALAQEKLDKAKARLKELRTALRKKLAEEKR